MKINKKILCPGKNNVFINPVGSVYSLRVQTGNSRGDSIITGSNSKLIFDEFAINSPPSPDNCH